MDKRSPIADSMIRNLLETMRYYDGVLAISHTHYLSALGGVEKVVLEEQAACQARRISYLHVCPCFKKGAVVAHASRRQLVRVTVDNTSVGNMTLVQLALILRIVNESRSANIFAMHIHHLMHFSVAGIQWLAQALSPKVCRMFVHDYHTICPQYNLLRNQKQYCAGPSIESGPCRSCRSGEERRRRHVFMNQFLLQTPSEYIAPSRAAADIWAASSVGFLAPRVRVVPHQTAARQMAQQDAPARLALRNRADDRIKIAFLGHAMVHKGVATWFRLTADRRLRARYRFYHLGTPVGGAPNVTVVPVSFLKGDTDDMVAALKRHKIDIALLWSIWPETYCFTMYEALAAGCFVITNPVSGNIAATIASAGQGVVCGGEASLFSFLSDVRRVENLLAKHKRTHDPVRLAFNSELVGELAASLPIGAQGAPSLNRDYSRWSALLSRISVEQKDGLAMAAGEAARERRNGGWRRRMVETLRACGDRSPEFSRLIHGARRLILTYGPDRLPAAAGQAAAGKSGEHYHDGG